MTTSDLKLMQVSDQIRFNLFEKHTLLRIKKAADSLSNVDVNDMMAWLKEESSSSVGLVSIDTWLALAEVYNLDLELMKKLFTSFDPMNSTFVDFSEVVCGLLCLFPGSKSIKLSLAFSLFDPNRSGSLSRRSLWRMLRSFIRGVSFICSFSHGNSDDVAVLCTSKIFAYLKNPRSVSLEDMSNWYTFCGHEISFWLELLDTSKWFTTITQ